MGDYNRLTPQGRFRAEFSAASLKQGLRQLGHERSVSFRAEFSAASLKQATLGSIGDAVGVSALNSARPH